MSLLTGGNPPFPVGMITLSRPMIESVRVFVPGLVAAPVPAFVPEVVRAGVLSARRAVSVGCTTSGFTVSTGAAAVLSAAGFGDAQAPSASRTARARAGSDVVIGEPSRR